MPTPINQTLNQGIPQITFPFVDDLGNITQPWYQLLIALWKRTGGGSSPGFVSEVNTGQGLTGGPINAANPSGTISLAPIESGDLLANATSASVPPAPTTLSNWLDFLFGTNTGQLLYRSGTGWTSLAIGTTGQALEVVSGVPAWATIVIPSGAELLPLVNGDLPGPSLMADPLGQCIGVPVG